eukprot:2270686-Pyramimonas_sp.AAC.1
MQVDLYGFSSYNRYEHNGARKGKTPYHYFDAVAGSTAVHSFDLAREVSVSRHVRGVPMARSMAAGLWLPVYGRCSMLYGIWSVVCGLWSMAAG